VDGLGGAQQGGLLQDRRKNLLKAMDEPAAKLKTRMEVTP
jgi:hypothetical protein